MEDQFPRYVQNTREVFTLVSCFLYKILYIGRLQQFQIAAMDQLLCTGEPRVNPPLLSSSGDFSS